MFDSFKDNTQITSTSEQHDKMNKKVDKYWKTRYDFFYSYLDFWKINLDNILADNPTNLISGSCGTISTSNTMDANIRSYICNQIEAHG